MGALWMLAAGVLFAAMGVCTKLAADQLSAAELVFYRSLFGLTTLGTLAFARGWPVATPHWRLHLSRGLSGLVSLGMYFYCIAHLPLATAVTLNYTSPLFLALLTTVLMGERFRAALIAGIGVSFLGVVLLLEPSLREDQLPEAAIGLGSGLLAAVAYVNVKQLGATGEPGWRVVLHFTLVSTVVGFVWAAATGLHAVTPRTAWLILGLGSTATAAQFAMTRAYHTGHTLVVGALAYSTVVFATLFSTVIWGDRLEPAAWAGIALVIAGGVLSLRASRRA
jgi:drug/metabolite transporter (DMT)-like permease